MSLYDAVTIRDIEPELEARPEGDRVLVQLRIPDIVKRFGHWRDLQIQTERGTVKIRP